MVWSILKHINMNVNDEVQTLVGLESMESRLRHLYEDEGYSIAHLAQLFDCSPTAIIDDLCDLDLLDADELFPDRLPRLATSDYERWRHGPHRVRVHRLVMVAECGFEAVADAVEIHHESFPWDNRADALVLCETRQEHKDLHADSPGEHEAQRELSAFDSSQVESDSSERTEEPEESDEAGELDVEMENQRTLDEFVRV